MSQNPIFSRMAQLEATNGVLPFIYDTTGENYRQMTTDDVSALRGFYDFYETLPFENGESVTIENYLGLNSISMHVSPPSGAKVKFSASFGENEWVDISLRQIGYLGYTRITPTGPDEAFYIGSIAGATAIKFTIVGDGSESGHIGGRMIRQIHTIEGIEQGPPPHRIGNQIIHKGFYINTNTGDYLLWQPESGYRFVITDIQFSNDQNKNLITFYEGSGNVSNPNCWITAAKLASEGSFQMSYSLPYVASGLNNGPYINTTTSSDVYGTVHGYETIA